MAVFLAERQRGRQGHFSLMLRQCFAYRLFSDSRYDRYIPDIPIMLQIPPAGGGTARGHRIGVGENGVTDDRRATSAVREYTLAGNPLPSKSAGIG